MTLEVVCSTKMVFILAGLAGEAKMLAKREPTPENIAAAELAKKRHDDYVQCYLSADRVA